MLTRRDGDSDFVKVLDFGLAKLSAGATPGDTAATAQKLTQLGEIFGTPQYMAPEQTTGGEADGRSDLYALGMILFEMLAGRLPFDGKNISDFLRHQLATPLPPLRKRAPQVDVPDRIEALLRRLCEKRPEDRFQSAEQFLEALELAAQEQQLVLAPPRLRASSPAMRDRPSGAPQTPPGQALAPVAAGAPRAAALPNTASMVMFMQAVGRAQKRLPGAMQRVSPEKLAALLAVLGVVVFVGVFFVISAVRSAGLEPAEKVVRPPAPPPKPVAPTAEELQAATAAGIPGLQQLAQRFPEAPEALRALASAYLRNGQAGPALSTLGQLARKDPQAVDNPEFVQFLTAQVMSNREETASAALRVVERDFGDRGVELLMKWADSVPARSRGRFNASFANLRARTDLSPPTQALLELRAATKCEQKHVALLRVRQLGDARSLPLLYALQNPKGCAPFGLGDCWGCLRQGTDLEDTIQAVTSRTAGAGSGTGAETGTDAEDNNDE